MKKKLISLILALVCAIACVFGLVACDDGSNKKTVKNEKDWKDYIADARNSERINFRAQYTTSGSGQPTVIKVQVNGNVQYFESGSFKWYYDGEYVYEDVSSEGLDYVWKKYRVNKNDEEFVEPKNYIEKVYSGEMTKEIAEWFGVDLTFDGLDEISNRYNDAELQVVEDIADGYKIEEVKNIYNDYKRYTVYFDINRSYTRLTYNVELAVPYGDTDNSLGVGDTIWLNLQHEMGNTAIVSTIQVPTTSVKEVAPNN